MCGAQGYHICETIKPAICTPDIEVDRYNIHKEVLCFMDLPVPKSHDRDHCISPTEARDYIDSNNVSFDRLQMFMLHSNTDTDEKKAIKQSKKLNIGRSFNDTKVRGSVRCYSCGASRIIYSDHDVGSNNFPTTKQQEDLERPFKN